MPVTYPHVPAIKISYEWPRHWDEADERLMQLLSEWSGREVTPKSRDAVLRSIVGDRGLMMLSIHAQIGEVEEKLAERKHTSSKKS